MALRNRKASRGFTLIELLVVVAIIGLLAAFAVPKLFEAINKSKGAQGDADLKTISAALERYYFDHNAYPVPVGANDAAKMTDLKTKLAEYLKKGATLKNGFGQGFFYGTDATGTAGFVLIDPKNEQGTYSSVCGHTGLDWTPSASMTFSAALTSTEISACALPTTGVGKDMRLETN